MISIVNIDDDKKWQSILRYSFSDYSIIPSYSGRSGINIVRNRNPDVVLLHKSLNDMRWREVLRKLKELPGSPPVIVVGECTKPRDVVTSIKSGAVDYVKKPYDLKELKASILNAVRLNIGNGDSGGTAIHPELEVMVGESGAIRKLKRDLFLFAGTDAPILITGETGTGKDLAAKMIHRISGRKEGPFLVMNAGGIPPALLDSQLYGTERGAYTDAVSSAGYFERADRGTLFIDEIGEMPVSAQSKMLRILEEKEIYRMGGRKSFSVDVRVITATNRDVPGAIEKGEFRKDLFFRISTLSLYIPPLRERKADLPLLVNYFLTSKGKKTQIDHSALLKLYDYGWPGNVRQLRNVILRAEILSDNGLIKSDNVVFDPL